MCENSWRYSKNNHYSHSSIVPGHLTAILGQTGSQSQKKGCYCDYDTTIGKPEELLAAHANRHTAVCAGHVLGFYKLN